MTRLYRLLLLCLTMLFMAPAFAQDAEKSSTQQYIGVKACAKCHKTTKHGKQLAAWNESAHANAFQTLKSEEAVAIAKEKGIAVAPHEAKECLQCHVAGFDAPAEMMSARFKVEDGVQCESCHGAGSMYKKKKVMKDRDKSIEMGMNAIAVEDGSAEKMCLECHNEKSPTFKPFVFKERWTEIEHPVPAK